MTTVGPPRAARRSAALAVALSCVSVAAQASSSASYRLEPAFNDGSARQSSASFVLTGCLDAGLAGRASSASHTLVAGCGALLILAGDGQEGYHTVSPCRVLDTRSGPGPLSSGTAFPIALAGSCGIPANAIAVALNLTVVAPSGMGGLEAYQADVAPPSPLIVVNFNSGQTRANNALVRVSPTGSIAVRPTIPGGGTVHVVIDVFGYMQ